MDASRCAAALEPMETWQGDQAVGEALQSGPADTGKRLVLLHGWGADADDLIELGRQLCGERRQLLALRARLGALGRSLPLEHTVLLGFSQGAAMALDGGSELALEGIVACSGYPHPGWQAKPAMAKVLLTHGKNDPVVPYAASEELLRLLQLQQARVELVSSAGQHGIDAELLPAIRRFIDPEPA